MEMENMENTTIPSEAEIQKMDPRTLRQTLVKFGSTISVKESVISLRRKLPIVCQRLRDDSNENQEVQNNFGLEPKESGSMLELKTNSERENELEMELDNESQNENQHPRREQELSETE